VFGCHARGLATIPDTAASQAMTLRLRCASPGERAALVNGAVNFVGRADPAGAYQLRRRREAILERVAALRLFVGINSPREAGRSGASTPSLPGPLRIHYISD
jgi:hypothetical protein